MEMNGHCQGPGTFWEGRPFDDVQRQEGERDVAPDWGELPGAHLISQSGYVYRDPLEAPTGGFWTQIVGIDQETCGGGSR